MIEFAIKRYHCRPDKLIQTDQLQTINYTEHAERYMQLQKLEI